jgi:hypothetical protein
MVNPRSDSMDSVRYAFILMVNVILTFRSLSFATTLIISCIFFGEDFGNISYTHTKYQFITLPAAKCSIKIDHSKSHSVNQSIKLRQTAIRSDGRLN